MKIMSLDLEMAQPSSKIIQVGAVILESSTGEIVDHFMVHVNPQEKLTKEITELTGITDWVLQLEGLSSVKDAYLQLKSFKEQYEVFQTPILWGSGDRSDSSELYRQSGETLPNFMGQRVTDVKSIYQSFRLLAGGKVRSGLENSMNNMGLKWNTKFGKPHDALADAHNTAIFWLYLTKLMKSGYDLGVQSNKNLDFFKNIGSK